MHNWNRLVRERLGHMDLPDEQQEQVVAELAAHLEDLYQEELAAGIPEPVVLERLAANKSNRQRLAKNIELAKCKGTIVNNRTKQIWMPGLLALFVSLAWMILLQMAASVAHLSLSYSGVPLPNVVWIVSLLFIGAASGYLSRRAGSTRPTCIAVAAFPSIAMALVWLLVLVVMLLRRQPFETIGFGFGFLHAIVIPAIALIIGTLPFLRANKLDDSRSSS